MGDERGDFPHPPGVLGAVRPRQAQDERPRELEAKAAAAHAAEGREAAPRAALAALVRQVAGVVEANRRDNPDNPLWGDYTFGPELETARAALAADPGPARPRALEPMAVREALEEIVAVLGTGDCAANRCEACHYSMKSAASTARDALTALDTDSDAGTAGDGP